jgi:SAM-dependent methyltransferase
MAPDGRQWHPALYAGSAAYYTQGRVAYPAELADRVATELGLDGSGRLADIGCGPGSLTLLLAPRFASAIGVDADQDMLLEADRNARRRNVTNVDWRCLRAEELPAELGQFRVISFAQSFHWMDRERVAATARGMLETGGALLHVHATTHEGIAGETPLPFPRPPRDAVNELVRKYLGPNRPAGPQGIRPGGAAGNESEIYRSAGFTDPVRIEIPGRIITRSVDDIVAATFSLSSSTPHLFGERAPRFESELRALLLDASPQGGFSEQMREIAVDVWRT